MLCESEADARELKGQKKTLFQVVTSFSYLVSKSIYMQRNKEKDKAQSTI